MCSGTCDDSEPSNKCSREKKRCKKRGWACPVTDSNRCLPAARMQTGIYLARNVPSYTNGPLHGRTTSEETLSTMEVCESWDDTV